MMEDSFLMILKVPRVESDSVVKVNYYQVFLFMVMRGGEVGG